MMLDVVVSVFAVLVVAGCVAVAVCVYRDWDTQ